MLSKKYTLLTICFIFINHTISVNGMYQGIQITEPYSPDSTLQYPKRLNTGSSIVLATRYLNTHNQYNRGINGAFEASFIANSPDDSYNTAVYNKAVKSHHLLNSLLTNPIQVLEKNAQIREECFSSLKKQNQSIKSESIEQTIARYKARMLPFQDKQAIFLFDECKLNKDNSLCFLARKKNPEFNANSI